MRCRISGSFGAHEIPLLVMLFYLFHQVLSSQFIAWFLIQGGSSSEIRGRHHQVGSLAGAAHLLNNNTGVLRLAHCEQKSQTEQKGKS
jgi:hypothetical protein